MTGRHGAARQGDDEAVQRAVAGVWQELANGAMRDRAAASVQRGWTKGIAGACTGVSLSLAMAVPAAGWPWAVNVAIAGVWGAVLSTAVGLLHQPSPWVDRWPDPAPEPQPDTRGIVDNHAAPDPAP